MEQVVEAPPRLANHVPHRDLYVAQEQLIRLAVEHRADPRPLDPLRLAKVDKEQGEPLRRFRPHRGGRRAGDEDHQVALLDPGDEHLPPPDSVDISRPVRRRRDPREVAPRVRFREGEALHPQLAAGEGGQVCPSERLRGEAGEEEGEVVLPVEGLGVPPTGVDLLEDEARVREGASRAAVRLGEREGPEPLVLESGDERLGVRLSRVEVPPVLGSEGVHQPPDGRYEDALRVTSRGRHATPPPACGP